MVSLPVGAGGYWSSVRWVVLYTAVCGGGWWECCWLWIVQYFTYMHEDNYIYIKANNLSDIYILWIENAFLVINPLEACGARRSLISSNVTEARWWEVTGHRQVVFPCGQATLLQQRYPSVTYRGGELLPILHLPLTSDVVECKK